MENLTLRHLVQVKGRVVGNTYRMVMLAVLFASARKDFTCMLVFGNRPALNYAVEMARIMTQPLGPFARVYRSGQKVTFDNGSTIHFILAGNDTPRGILLDDFGVDTSVERLDPKVYDWLQLALKRN